MKILFVVSELAPWVKTGGLGDVAQGLPQALSRLGHDVRILLPAYGSVLAKPIKTRKVSKFKDATSPIPYQLLSAEYGEIKVWLIDTPGFKSLEHNPYHNQWGDRHHGCAEHFNLLSRVAAVIAGGQAGMRWRPELVHCNDWQSALAPVWMLLKRINVASLFTIHNLHYHGLFPAQTLKKLGLPWWLMHADALEYYGEMSFIKGGLVFADKINTVSPTYAKEICTTSYGQGLDGLLQHRQQDIVGILNGIDTDIWDPKQDPHICAPYSAKDTGGKQKCKSALQTEFSLPMNANGPLLGVIARLVPQKGIDLIINALPEIFSLGAQVVILGSGEHHFEQQLKHLAQENGTQMAVHIGFDEALAHRIEAGSDLFLMPSRFEPCGLNQMYSMCYGTLPIVSASGGLIDSVTDINSKSLKNGKGTGFVLNALTSTDLHQRVAEAIELYHQRESWKQLVSKVMKQDFSWQTAAQQYEKLYEHSISSFKSW